MKTVNKFSLALFATAAALAISPFASADTITTDYNFIGLNVDPSSVAISLTITTTDAGGGAYDITNVTGTVSDTNTGVSGPVSFPLPAGYTNTADGLWQIDNMLFPSGSAPGYTGSVFDNYGLLIDAGAYEINIWGNGGNSYTLGESLDGSYIQMSESIQLSPDDLTPEPDSFLLHGTGLLGLAFILFRRGKSPEPILNS